MSIETSSQETINALKAIFEKHENERICVLATTCCGKTTLLRQIPNCVDLDDELWPQLTKEAVEQDWNSHREKGGKAFYYLVLTE